LSESDEPEKTPYEQLGGGDAVRALVDRFYELMDSLDEAQTIRALHARDLRSSRDKLFKFLSGWLGGPSLYVAEYGHPRLRQRHFPFAIDTAAANAWMKCMTQAVNEAVSDSELSTHLLGAFGRLALHMRNQPDPA